MAAASLPATLDLVTSLLTTDSVVLPGHGAPVDADVVRDLRDSIGRVAEQVRSLAGRRVGPDQMAEAAVWPYPVEHLTHAFTRGFTMLPRSARSLPLA